MAIIRRVARAHIVNPTEHDLSQALVSSASAPFPARRYLCVPNVSWGILPYEADLLAISEAGWCTEIEIKVSIADLQRDAEKSKFLSGDYGGGLIQSLIYAMPDPVWQQAADSLRLPAFAGVLSVELFDDGRARWHRRREPQKMAHARRWTDQQKLQVLRLGMMRWWARDN